MELGTAHQPPSLMLLVVFFNDDTFPLREVRLPIIGDTYIEVYTGTAIINKNDNFAKICLYILFNLPRAVFAVCQKKTAGRSHLPPPL